MKSEFNYDIPINEDKVMETIAVSEAAFLSAEAKRSLSHLEFLAAQSRLIKKRWWLLQGLLLALVYLFLQQTEADYLTRRALGLAGPLFVILILPELWKNRNFDAMEVECTTYYTIRSIYAARLTLFAGVDLLLLTAFFIGASFFARVTVMELLIQFLLPFNVACGICFQTLYGGRNNSEAFSILLCSVWTGLWILVVLNDAVYNAISVPVWMFLLTLSFVFMGFSLRKGQKTIYWQSLETTFW